MASIGSDIRLALRLLRRDRLFALLAVLTLAAGLTSALLVFSLANAVLLRPLPYPQGHELVLVTDQYPRADIQALAPSVPEALDFRASTAALADLAFVDHRDLQVRGRAQPERVQVGRASVNFFSLLGVRAALGRTFGEEDRGRSESEVVVLSHALWQRLYGGDPKVVGQAISLSGRAGTIVGVLPRTFAFDYLTLGIPEAVELYTPFPNSPDYTTRAGSLSHRRRVLTLARLKPDVTLDQARADIRRVAAQLARDHPRLYTGPKGEDTSFTATVTPLREAIVSSSRASLWLLLGAVGLIMLIACANAASLMLTRAIARQPELAIRAALGASRWRLIRQFLTESLVIALASGALGLLLTGWLLPLAVWLAGAHIPRLAEASIDGRVLLAALLLSLATALLFGAAPAAQNRPDTLTSSLAATRTRALASPPRGWLRSGLVIAQVALSIVLLVGAGLLTRSLLSLQHAPLGFAPERLLTMRLSLPYAAYQGRANASMAYEDLLRRIEATPGVIAAAMSTAVPARGGSLTSIAIAGRPNGVAEVSSRLAVMQYVSSGYFETLGLAPTAGRTFTPADDARAPRVAVINETMARRFWPDADPLGAQLLFFEAQPLTIVGIVPDTRGPGLVRERRPQLYRPLLQVFEPNMTLIVRTAGAPLAMTRDIQQAVWAQDPGQALFRVETMETVLAEAVAEPRQRMLVSMVVSGLALVMALAGLFGIVAYRVAQRTPEIGLRMALGARTGDVLGLLLRQMATLVLAGMALGVAGSLAASRLTARLLYGASALDAATYAAAALLFALTALLASYVPARRATRIDPVKALRGE